MIDEKFLQSAVKIRKQYLKMTTDISGFQKKTQSTLQELNKTVQLIEQMHSKLQGKEYSEAESIKKINDLLLSLTQKAESLEQVINPVNEDIEKLAKEEQELYERIKQKHFDLTEEQIVESVRERLIKEGLS